MSNQIILKKKENPSDKFVTTAQLKFEGIERTYDSGKIVLDDRADGDQHGQAELTIRREGEHYDVSLKGTFWNGRLFDGDTFVAMAWFADADGNKLETIRVQRGVDARGPFRRHPRKRRKSKSVDLSAGLINRIDTVVLTLGYRDIVDDRANWVTVINAAKIAIQQLG